MSGGAYEYFYERVESVANEIERRGPRTPLRAAFVTHLRRVAEALHDVEWVDSGDYSPGDEEAAIRKVIPRDGELAAAYSVAMMAKADLDKEIQRARATMRGPLRSNR